MGDEYAQPQVRTTPYSSPMHNFGGSILLLTNPDNELHKLELTLKNMVQDKDGIAHPAGRPLMNDEGVSSVIGQVQTFVNQVTVMSNLEPREIPLLVDFLADTLARDLMANRVKYDIVDSIAARDKIFFTALGSSFICLKRANEEGERRFWKGSQQEITTRIDGGGSSRGGVFGKIMGWK